MAIDYSLRHRTPSRRAESIDSLPIDEQDQAKIIEGFRERDAASSHIFKVVLALLAWTVSFMHIWYTNITLCASFITPTVTLLHCLSPELLSQQRLMHTTIVVGTIEFSYNLLLSRTDLAFYAPSVTSLVIAYCVFTIDDPSVRIKELERLKYAYREA